MSMNWCLIRNDKTWYELVHWIEWNCLRNRLKRTPPTSQLMSERDGTGPVHAMHISCKSIRYISFKEVSWIYDLVIYDIYIVIYPLLVDIYNNSLTWIVRPFGDDSPYYHDSSEGEQGFVVKIYPYIYNVCIYIDIYPPVIKRGNGKSTVSWTIFPLKPPLKKEMSATLMTGGYVYRYVQT